MNRLVVTLPLVLLAAIGGQTRAVAKALPDSITASGEAVRGSSEPEAPACENG